MIDLIGDIHGHATELEALLTKLGYTKINGVFTHPTRKVLFVGDYIDRGPKIRETLEIVKAMTDHGEATALMGNHEYNALCFHFQESEGGHLRKHLIKNIVQHYETLKQFQNRQKEYDDYLDWFLTLPLFYETETFRAVHACWDQSNIDYLRNIMPDGKLTDTLVYESAKKGSKLNVAVDETLKGKEITMPAGLTFTDKDGTTRTEIRIKWWEDHCRRTGGEMNNNPSPGNKAGGLTTILEKSLGAVAKGGTTNLVDVYEYAQPITAKGFVYMDSPGYDPVSATGQVAGGANVLCFTTGRGSVFGCKPTPSLKLATNTSLYRRMTDDMDINCGTIVDGEETIQENGRRIFDLILATASGEKTKSEVLGIGDDEFEPWKIGATM